MTPRRPAPGALLALTLTLTVALAAGCGAMIDGSDDDVAGGTLIRTDDGPVRGEAADGVASWRGIPYAAPPVGDLRWRAPAPVERWSGARDAKDFAHACLQGTTQEVVPGSAEDCLYLNVFRPAGETRTDLPVMVWIHGGGLKSGSGDLEPEMVTGLVEQGVVLVSINYRLGRLGYLAHPALAAEAEAAGEEPVANFGLLDQVAALEWVQDNVGEFGGDADLVTIFGISAGGIAVNDLMTSPLADGLFDRAISGSGLGREESPPYADAAAQGETLAAGLGAAGADARTLRDLDGDEVAKLDAFVLRNEVPILDAALPQPPWKAFQQGKEYDVPYLAGTTDLEFIEVNFQALGLDPEVVTQQLVAGSETEAAAAYGSAPELGRHFLNDVVFTEPARWLAQAHAERSPSYLYRFSIANEKIRSTYGGALHGDDFHFVFGHGDQTVANSDELAGEMAQCWVSFARTGTPECGDVDWPQADDGAFVDFTNDGPVVVDDDPWQARLDLVTDLYAQAVADGVPASP